MSDKIKQLHDIYGEDVNQTTSLVMSGVESDTYWDIAIGEGIDRLLVSYHYIQRKGKNFIRNRLEKHPNVKLMIDSGAHTFHSKEEEYKQKPLEFWEKYLQKYIDFIRANKEFIFSCVELDIANIVGFDKVDYFREKYFEPLKAEGILVCYVWHDYDGAKYWDYMCKKYDYVGFSLVNSSLKESQIVKMMNTARRYGALVHGFALTRVEIMSRVPFFTGDSTTWLVGTQYGELNWFDGRRMRRLKKDKWKKEYKQKYIKIGANWDLAGKENPYELIRINLIVFKQAETYIKKRVKAKAYWMKKGTGGTVKTMSLRKKPSPLKIKKKTTEEPPKEEVKQQPQEQPPSDIPERPKTKFEEFQEMSSGGKELRDLDSLQVPDLEWFEGETDNWKDYARQFGLENLGKDDCLDILFNYTLYIYNPEKLEEFDDEMITEMAKTVLNKSVEGREEAIEELTDYYTKNATGEREDFLGSDMFSMEAPEKPKERDEYLEDEEFEYIDIPDDELASMLPEPKEGEKMPEVEELDKELREKGIEPVRDEKGRFLKGQKKVKKPKQLWSKHFPKLACNTCYKAGECPEYKPDHACAYEKLFQKFDTRNMEDVIDAVTSMANVNMERMQRLMLFETLDGGMTDPALTSMIDQNLNIMNKLRQLHESKDMIIAKQTRTMRADGTETTETTVSNPSGGILSQIFGGGDSKEERERKEVSEDEVIEAEE